MVQYIFSQDFTFKFEFESMSANVQPVHLDLSLDKRSHLAAPEVPHARGLAVSERLASF